MRTAISKKWTFDAAHVLPNHGGKCSQPHGHTYTVTVRVSGPVQPIDGRSSEGMVCDFAVLDGVWQAIKPALDHRDLNGEERSGVLQGLEISTSEHIAAFLFDYFQHFLDDAVPEDLTVELVRVSETAATYAEVRA